MNGTSNMMLGVLWCVIGIAATAFFFSGLKGGGTHIVAYATCVIGGWQFLAGFGQFLGGK